MEKLFKCCLFVGLIYFFGGLFLITVHLWLDLDQQGNPGTVVKQGRDLPDFKDGSPHCRMYSLQELCTSMKAAVACEVTPFCIHCEWTTAFSPNDANNGKCESCQDALANVNATPNSGAYSRVLKSICNLHMKYHENEVCIKTFEYLLSNQQEIWSINPSALSNLDTCSLLGMCYSPFALLIPDNSEIKNELQECWGGKGYLELKNSVGAKVVKFEPEDDPNLKRIEYQKHFPIFKEGSEGVGGHSKYICKFENKERFWVKILPIETVGRLLLALGFILLAFAGVFRIFMAARRNVEGNDQNQNQNVAQDDFGDDRLY